ncbi:ATP-binding cassette domain-containing protein [Micromonospora sp. NBC_01796]|uniref:ATP-binding cassette domain-containing protein n=1 Tax=Micromonospora sp. NBC_01796 TaxID=2975987 RepID=UPI002DDA16F6|nr:ATP-binding cassette domain-containing protein [Micromonospora sp. NBC_01796]WSA85936.1 ATP-binding cassette domain-containing protein [Micromonospora sp. NBC_01796]
MDLAIEVEALGKSYGGRAVLSEVSLTVPAGTVLGVLGPNGAGKTTMVRILTTLLAPDRGRVRVAGFDVVGQAREVRRKIGLSGQYAAVDDTLTGEENIVLLARLSRLGRRRSRERATELLERFDLTDAARRPVRTYSGGMRRRLDLATCLIAEPPVLFLDEPTTGLDPTSRATLWALVRDQVAEGVTVLLTTQYLEEADQLANQLVVIDSGRVIAEGTPDELKRKVGGERLEVSVRADLVPAALAALVPVAVGPPMVSRAGDTVSAQLISGIDSIAEAAAALRAAGLDVTDFALRRPSLDDVFFQLTGAPTTKGGES